MQLFYDVQGSPVPISQLEKGPGAGENSGHYSAAADGMVLLLQSSWVLIRCSDPASTEADRWPPEFETY